MRIRTMYKKFRQTFTKLFLGPSMFSFFLCLGSFSFAFPKQNPKDAGFWDPILDLMENGAKIMVRNERNVSPLDLLPPLARLQRQLVADCWLGLVLEDAAHMTEHSEQGMYT